MTLSRLTRNLSFYSNCFMASRSYFATPLKLLLTALFVLVSLSSLLAQTTVLFREDFTGASVEPVPGASRTVRRWAQTPVGYGGIQPTTLNLGNLNCGGSALYMIGTSTQNQLNGSSWVSTAGQNGNCYFGNVATASLPDTASMMGAYMPPPANIPFPPTLENRLVWRTKQHLEAGHAYRMKIKLADLGVGGLDAIDYQETRFGAKIWCIPVNGPTPTSPVSSVGQVSGTGTNSLTLDTPCFAPGVGDYILGVELISNNSNSNCPNGANCPNPPTIMYFAIGDILIEDGVQSPPAPIVPDAMVACPAYNLCGGVSGTATMSVTNPVLGTTYDWYSASGTKVGSVTCSSAGCVVSYQTSTISTSTTYTVVAKTPCGTSPATTVRVTVPPQITTVLFREDFTGASVEPVPGASRTVRRWAQTPVGYGGIQPTTLNLGNLNCGGSALYMIGTSTQNQLNGSSWVSTAGQNGNCYFGNVATASLPDTASMMGAYMPPPANIPFPPTLENRLVWRTKQHLEAGHAYRMKIKLADLGVGGLDAIDYQETRFGAKIWCIPVNGPTPTSPVSSVGQVSGTGTNSLTLDTPCFAPGVGDYILGVELISNNSNSNCPNGANCPNPPTIMYFAIGDILIEDIRCGILTPSLTSAYLQTCGTGPQTFTIVSPGGTSGTNMPVGAQFEWYTKTVSGVRQNAIVTSNRTFTVAMPINQSSGVPALYYVDLLMSNGDRSAEVELRAAWHQTSAAFTIDAGFSGTAPYLQGYQIRFVAQTGYNQYVWHWDDGSADDILPGATGFAVTHSFATKGSHAVKLTVYKNYNNYAPPCVDMNIMSGLVVIAPLCEAQILEGGDFKQNTRSGAISYVSSASTCIPDMPFECLSEGAVMVPQVVAATATAFSDQLVTSPSPAPLPGTPAANPYLNGLWQVSAQANYTFRATLDADTRNYSAGTYVLRPFDWESSLRARPASWITSGIAEHISPNGETLQERDLLGIPSAAKFGYGKTALGVSSQALPYVQAHNAEGEAILFESFENVYTVGSVSAGEDGLEFRSAELQVTTTQAHTGQASAMLTGRQMTLKSIPLTAQLNGSGLLIKAWVRATDATSQLGVTVELTRNQTGSAFTFPCTTTVRTGEWMLYEAVVPMSTSSADLGELLTPRLRFTTVGASNIWIDDVRVQPRDAQMTAYVYDPTTLRLLASFDDQHFALRYQYNAEGKLIRKQVETERGLKTVQETQYHVPSTNDVNN